MSENELYDEIKSAWEEAQAQKVRVSEAAGALYDEASAILHQNDVDADVSQAVLSDISRIETDVVEVTSARFDTLGALVRSAADVLERDEPTLRNVRSDVIRASEHVLECAASISDAIEGKSFDVLDETVEDTSVSDDIVSLLTSARLHIRVLSNKLNEVGAAFDDLIKSISTR